MLQRSLYTIRKTLPNISKVPYQTVRMASEGSYDYETLQVTRPSSHVLHVELNRPDKRNAMNQQFFVDIRKCFKQIDNDPSTRAVILSGAGKHFTSGLDLMSFASGLMGSGSEEVGRRAFQLRTLIKELQESFTVVEKCRQPVIATVHSACVGGGVDLMCACDIRMCTSDAWFSIKEVDIGLAADIGTLQRLPKIIGNHSLLRELAYTARKMQSDEAKNVGFVSRVFDTKKEMLSKAVDLASTIATKSPVAISTTKLQLNYARDHTVDEGLDYIASWNMAMLQSQDMLTAAQSSMQKQEPTFDDFKSKL